MTTISRAWGPHAITRWTLLVTSVMVLVVGLSASVGTPEYTLLWRILIAAGSTLPALVVLAAARLTWLAPEVGGNRAPRALATFAVAGGVAGATRGWLIDLAGIVNPIASSWRIPAMALAGVIWLSIVAVLVDHVRAHRATMTSLRAHEANLAELNRQEREDLESVTGALRRELTAPARDALGRISSELAQFDAGDQLSVAAARVDEAVTATIRPLSHDLLAVDTEVVPAPVPVREGKARRHAIRLVGLAARRVTHAPWLVSAIPVILFPLIAGPRWGLSFLVVNAVVTWVALSVSLVVLRRALEPVLARLPTVAALVLLISGLVLVAAIAVSIMRALDPLSPLDVGFQAIALITIPTILFGGSLLEASAELDRRDERVLREVIAETTWSLARLRQRIRREHEMLGALLHGTAQGELMAIVRSLESVGDDAAPEERERVVEAALERLERVQALLQASPAEGQRFDEALGSVTEMWARVLEIDVDVSAGVRASLDAHPAAGRTLVDVVAEALTNAVRHGGARYVRVTAEVRDRILEVRVEDDGSLAASVVPGMGSHLFDEASPDWSLSRAGARTVLRATIPLG